MNLGPVRLIESSRVEYVLWNIVEGEDVNGYERRNERWKDRNWENLWLVRLKH
jgi:hypothetical protein